MKKQKTELRKKMLAQRDQLTPSQIKEYSSRIADSCRQIISEKKPKNMLVYLNYLSEVETRSIIKHMYSQGISVHVPRVNFKTKQLEIVPITAQTKMILSKYGIEEPAPECSQIDSKIIDFIIVPGTAFSKNLERMGYGGGYYDKLFERIGPAVFKAAVCFEIQIADYIPTEPTDIPMDIVITEKQIYK